MAQSKSTKSKSAKPKAAAAKPAAKTAVAKPVAAMPPAAPPPAPKPVAAMPMAVAPTLIISGGTINVATDKTVFKLKGNAVGLAGVLFLAVTGAAPMSAMLGNVPFAAGYGIGTYTPAAFLLATIVLTVFSIGFAAMASRVSSVGGFYSFISQGLGREVGMSAGLTSFICYSIFEASLTGLFAFFGNKWLIDHAGINVPWLVLALLMIAVISVLAYRDVKLSARILGVALITEVAMLDDLQPGCGVCQQWHAFLARVP